MSQSTDQVIDASASHLPSCVGVYLQDESLAGGSPLPIRGLLLYPPTIPVRPFSKVHLQHAPSSLNSLSHRWRLGAVEWACLIPLLLSTSKLVASHPRPPRRTSFFFFDSWSPCFLLQSHLSVPFRACGLGLRRISYTPTHSTTSSTITYTFASLVPDFYCSTHNNGWTRSVTLTEPIFWRRRGPFTYT